MFKRATKYFKEYFIFTKSEIRGTVALLIIIGVIILLRWLLPFYTGKYYNKINDVEFVQADSIVKGSNKLEGSNKSQVISNEDSSEQKIVLFEFDPNTVTLEDLIKLGFREKVAHTLINYRNAGAHFRRPEDIKRVYGMNDEFYDKIKPYISIK